MSISDEDCTAAGRCGHPPDAIRPRLQLPRASPRYAGVPLRRAAAAHAAARRAHSAPLGSRGGLRIATRRRHFCEGVIGAGDRVPFAAAAGYIVIVIIIIC
eukprot:1593138-Pyramimonas_sp.AAC.1